MSLSRQTTEPARAGAPLVLLAALAAALGACRCEETPAHRDAGPDASDGALADARPNDARTDGGPDARTDAQILPDAIQHDFCNEPFFKLPIDGQTERTVGVSMQNRRIAWSKQKLPAEYNRGDVYWLDLSSCMEQQITLGSQAGNVSIHGLEVFWDDMKDGFSSWCTELYSHDLSSGLTNRLTETFQCEIEPKSNGRYVAFRRMETDISAPSLRLLDRQTGEDIELSPDWTNIESLDINDRYVVWAAYTQDPQSVGRDVFYYDLATGETLHIDATYLRYQYWVFLWEDWITIRGSDAHLATPTFLSLYNISTQSTLSLVEGDYATSSGSIGSGLVSWNTSLYTGTTYTNPSDIELFQISSGLSRRLTTSQSNLRIRDIDAPYHLFVHRLFLPDSFQNDYYVANLEALGVLDASGVLIPGGPVIDPP